MFSCLSGLFTIFSYVSWYWNKFLAVHFQYHLFLNWGPIVLLILMKFVLSCTSYFPQTDNLWKVDSHVIQSDGKNLDFRQIFHLFVLNCSKYTSLYSPNLMPMREVIWDNTANTCHSFSDTYMNFVLWYYKIYVAFCLHSNLLLIMIKKTSYWNTWHFHD